MSQLHTLKQHPIKRNENRHLHQDWQAPTHGIDLFAFVQVHCLLGEFLPIIPVEILEAHHFWLQTTHVRHGTIAGSREFIECRLDENGQKNNRPTPISYQFVQLVQHPEQRFGNPPEPTVIHSQIKVRGNLFQPVLILGTSIKFGPELPGSAWFN